MKKLILALALLIAAPSWGTQYFLSPTGSDAANGTSLGTPWLSPNHSLNCGDVIQAAASTSYAAANFAEFKWGTVTCAANNNVAWLTCITFDACKITATGTANGMFINNSYWGVQGWEVSTPATTGAGACFEAIPFSSSIHHIIFANDIANVCGAGGFAFGNNGAGLGVDYAVVIGSIAYNAANDNFACFSNISIFQPLASDTLPGTHIYFAGNFSYDAREPNPCNGTAPTDGEGLFFDGWDGNQGLGTVYTQQGVIDNNISVLNGSKGVAAFSSSGIGSTHAHIYFRHNTTYGNDADPNVNTVACAEIIADVSFNVEAYWNLAQTSSATACTAHTNYVLQVRNGDPTDFMYQNYGYSAAGNNTSILGGTFTTFGPNNTFGTNPSFASVADPGAPSCGSFASVPACMATVIANFTPATAAAKPYGYQPVSLTSRVDPLYPQWLCSVTNLPTGLVTPGCATGSIILGMTVK
jgi:hypothetical protein